MFYLHKETYTDLLKHASRVFGILMLSYLASYGMNVFLSNHLSPADYGDISVILQILSFFVPFALLGTELSSLQFLPQYEIDQKWSLFRGFMHWALKLYFYSFIIINLVGLLVLLLILSAHFLSIRNWYEFHPIFFSIWVIPFFAALFLQSSFFQAIRKYTSSMIITSLGYPILLIIFLYLCLWYFKKLTVLLGVMSIGLTCGLLGLIQIVWLHYVLPSQLKQYHPEEDKSQWWKTSLKMLKGSITFLGLVSIDLVMLEILGKNEKEVGILAALLTIINILGIFNNALNVVVIPLIRLFKNKNQALQALLNKGILIKIIPSIFLYLLIILFGKNLLSFFGPEYVSAYYLLVILASVKMVSIAFSFSLTLLFYSPYIHINNYIAIGQLLFIILLDIILIPPLGIEGSVITSVIAQLLALILNTFYVKKLLGLRPLYIV